ncbi:hypothetical protein IAU60_006038 [Kwoniella sp. DSM 27419]
MESYQPNWHVRAITAPGPDSDLALHVSFDNARFLFGCGEGTQRAFTQKRSTLKGLAGIFVGSGEAKARAGLAGVLMTAADGGINKVDIVGPPDVAHYLATLRSSVIRDSLTVNMRAYPRSASQGELVEMFKSPNITVSGIALQPSPVAGPSTSTYDPFDPRSASFRPSRLSPSDVQRWTDSIVCDMFHHGPTARASRRPQSPRQSPSRPRNPFVNPDGTLCTSIPDTRYPLPVPSREDVETQMVYICQAPDVRGKFNVQKAKELGVPNGPVRGKLTRGEAIEVDDAEAPGGKRMVRPEDCLVGGGPGSVLIVVNCSQDTLPLLLANPSLDRYQPGKAQTEGLDGRHVHLMVHRVPRTVWQADSYQSWMTDFGPNTQHLIADPTEYPDRTVFNSAAWNTLQLSLLDSSIFTPPFVTSPHPPALDLPPNTTFLTEGAYCRMYPAAPVSAIPPHDKDVPFSVTEPELASAHEKIKTDMPDYAEAVDAAKAAVSADPRSTNLPSPRSGDDIVVTTLGTGSAIPSKYRNVSSTHLDVPGLGGILLDAGEGTLGQMRRRFGKEGVKRLLGELKMVFVSHMHADHHLGLTAILEERFKLGAQSPLFVIGPTNIALHMQESASWQYHATVAGLENVMFINIQRLGFRVENRGLSDKGSDQSDKAESESWDVELKVDGERGRKGWPFSNPYGFTSAATKDHWRYTKRLLRDLGLVSIWAPVVPHRGRAYGLSLEHTSGWKIVYSGDTKPSEALVEAGMNATLLIHEATLEDDKPEVAAQKGHSTFTQAIDIGKQMNASHILLNHFSQRYPKLPKLPVPEATEDGVAQPAVSISFDFMSLRVGDMWKMPYYMDAMSMLFAEVEEEGEGEDTVVGAVKGDVNPTLDAAGGSGKGGKKIKGNGDKGQQTVAKMGNEEQAVNGGDEGASGDTVKKGKRALKREAARAAAAAGKKQDPEAVHGGSKRSASPGEVEAQPQAKRRSTESEIRVVTGQAADMVVE